MDNGEQHEEIDQLKAELRQEKQARLRAQIQGCEAAITANQLLLQAFRQELKALDDGHDQR